MKHVHAVGTRVTVFGAPGLDGEYEGTVTDHLPEGYGVEVTGNFYCGTNGKSERRTETVYVEPKNIIP